MNYVTTSTGERIRRSVFDARIRKAKSLLLSNQRDRYGYNFCEDRSAGSLCGKNQNSGEFLDCSHNESVKSCIENGHPEKAYDVTNMTVRCRTCHQRYDKNGVQWS